MDAAAVVVLIAAAVACVGAAVALVAAWVLVGQVRRLERGIEALRHEAVPLVQDARLAADHAAAEIARVDAVLADTEAVTATVDRASRAARRAFANPVVKVLAWRAGAIGGVRRLRQGDRPLPRPVPVALVREGHASRQSRQPAQAAKAAQPAQRAQPAQQLTRTAPTAGARGR